MAAPVDAADSGNTIRGTNFDVGTRYTDLKWIGEGAYGMVCSATDTQTPNQERCAIKRIKTLSHPLSWQRTLRELMILQRFNHENIIGLRDMIKPGNAADLENLYLVQDLMDIDLYQLLRHRQLSDEIACYFCYQLLRGMKYIHSANVIHRDLKTSNILVNDQCDLMICDFGLARVVDADYDYNGVLTEYVSTRHYRAPEVMLSPRAYTKAIDIWSIGCILGEMLGNKVMFPGRDYVKQIELIMVQMPTPTEEDIESFQCERARSYITKLPTLQGGRGPAHWKRQFPTANPNALDLLDKLLVLNPNQRLTVDQAIVHPYCNVYHDAEDEPTLSEPFRSSTTSKHSPSRK